jgi:hypothetical protein
MPQETNLNVSPYYDDFDANKNYYRVLFKPSYPVQARELTTLQSILQNQIESFGNHFFKEGSVVIPGQVTYIKNFYAIEINDEFAGIPVVSYIDKLVGLIIKGRTSGITAKVVKVLKSEESERSSYTLYVEYIETSLSLSETNFFDNEVLESNTSIEIANNVFISPGEGFASTKSLNSSSIGSAFAISEGIYFVRGNFVSVRDEILILDQYANQPSYRIGFLVNESIVNYYEDPSLTDNARGFNNYAAPGADRLKIEVNLFKKAIDDFEDKNFIQLATVENGTLRDIKNKTDYSLILDELARRTNDESGDYYVKSFNVTVKDSLNDGFGNDGLYTINQKTQLGLTPSKDLAIYKVSPGKAYVKGYEIETIAPVFLDIKKPRDTKTVENRVVNFDFGPQLSLNRVYGFPLVGFNTTSIISLRDSRIGSAHSDASGNEIGVARVYDFYLESGSYSTSNLNENIWGISLYDVQTYSVMTLNQSVTLNTPVIVNGQQTGARGYLRSNVSSSSTITVYQINGKFSEKEVLEFEGDLSENQKTRYVTSIKNYDISDIKSLYSSPISGITFNADTEQSLKSKIGSATISAKIGSTSIITVSKNISGIVNSGDIVSYSSPGISTISYAKVDSINYTTKQITVSELEDVPGVCDGNLPISETTINDLNVLETKLVESDSTGNPADNQSLFSVLPKLNISSVDLSSSSITVRKQFSVSITSNSTNIISADPNEFFLPFDEERYALVRSNGTFERLTADKFTFIDGSTKIRIDNLGSNDSNCRLIGTLTKTLIKSKTKLKEVVGSIVLNKSNNKSSGTGSSSLNDGLTFGNYPYGTRIQDREICLNYPDIFKIHGIFESINENDPDSPSTSLLNMTGSTSTTNDLIIGDYFEGRTSGARAIYVERKNDTAIGFIYLNEKIFITNETIDFQQTKITANIGTILLGSKNITSKFDLEVGQRKSHYDYSRLIRKSISGSPIRKIKVYFARGYYDVSDSGDITTKESYNSFDYDTDIRTVGGVRLTDIIDLRPRVSSYTITTGSRSPFEFYGRDFSQGNHSSKDVISGSNPLILTYSYYLPRFDRIYLNKNSTFSVKLGVSSDNPTLPEEISGAMNIANIYLPPYLYSPKDATVEFIQHKRYQMKDISNIDQRVKNLEKNSTLSLLETKTENLFIDDGSGFNRFKSGFFVDNFTTLLTQDISKGIKNSIDTKNYILKPSHYTTNVVLEVGNDSMVGLGLTVDQNSDYRFSNIIGSNIKKSGNILTLDYSDKLWLRQPFATRSENVTPYLVTLWEGSVELNPETDVWIDTRIIEPNNVVMEGSFTGVAEALRVDVQDSNDGIRSGVSPVIWNSWETTGIDVTARTDTQSAVSGGGNVIITTTTERDFVGVGLDQQRSGTQFTVTEEVSTESFGDRIVSRELINFMRPRNIEFISRKLKPFTKTYPFFDGVDIRQYCFNKLLKIQMTSGVFQVGETVRAFPSDTPTSNRIVLNGNNTCSFRVATTNHKYGPYNNPTDFYDSNPYDRTNNIPSEYTASSTILNIDTFSLSNEVNTTYFGNIFDGMILQGQSSGAQAVIIDSSLITDRVGTLIGSFRVPDGTVNGSPKFETGRARFRLTSDSSNSEIPGSVTTFGEQTFYSQGEADVTQETTLSLRNARVDVDTSFIETRDLFDEALTETTVTTTVQIIPPPAGDGGGGRDPLAQTFFVDDKTGIFVTKLDLYFRTKDSTLPVIVQIREVEVGLPTKKILAFSEVYLTPDKVNTSEDVSIPTTFTFDAPVYLEPTKEYAIVVLSDSNEYNVWISRLGEIDVRTLQTEQNQVLVSSQNLLGSLFKSQNASTWTPSQYEDLCFTLYRAEFTTSGFTQFFNQNLPTYMEVMKDNPILIQSEKVRVSLSSTITSADLDFGSKVLQEPTGLGTATGTVIGFGGRANGSLTITNSGIGYTPSSGISTYTNITLRNISGTGSGALATITINNGVGVAASITSGGNGYVTGDILEPISIGSNNLGTGMRLTVTNITGRNEIILDNVQGAFVDDNTDPVKYVNSSNNIVNLNGGLVYISSTNTISDGKHIKIFHRNHGMYSETNYAVIKDIQSDISPTKLTSTYSSTSNASLPILDSTQFQTFEGLPVTALNPGYIKIGQEIIKYTGYTSTTLTNIERGIDNTTPFTYSANSLVEKYEIGGVSLRRINKSHYLGDVDSNIEDKIGVNHYYIKIDMGSRTDLKFNYTGEVGGPNAKASYNILFNAITPSIKSITPTGTSVSFEVNTVSGTSIGGDEVSFIDSGVETIENNKINYFETPRLLSSRINEIERLQDVSFNRSLSLATQFRTSDSRLSPAIDLARADLVLTSNIINNPGINYITNSETNTIYEDPHIFSYLTNRIDLSTPSSSLKVILDAYVNSDSDIRVFYSIGDDDIFIPFPGYSNRSIDGSVIDLSLSDGTSDYRVPKNDNNLFNPSISDFYEYEYTADNLSFKSFRLKIVGTSSNQAYVPMIKNLRAIALGAV